MLTGLGRPMFEAVWSVRDALGRALAQAPLWPELVRLAAWCVAPVTSAARAALQYVPGLRRLEGVLEVESLTRRHPMVVGLVLMYAAWRGLLTTPLGHMGTDPTIYPFMAFVSGYNPALGLASAMAYGAGDLIQKYVKPDMFGVPAGRADINFWPAMFGYSVSYSSLACMGVLPGVLARLARHTTRAVLRVVFARRAAESAAGAARPPHGVDPDRVVGSGATDAFPLPEFAAAMAGGSLGAYLTMDVIAPVLSVPAFMWRPRPDVSCLKQEVSFWLRGRSDIGATAGGAGGALVLATPPRDRPPWSLMNRPSTDHVWDQDAGRWVLAEDAHRQRMERDGCEFDPHTQTWRRPPPAVPVHSPSGEHPPVVDYVPFSFTDPSTERFESRLNELDHAERRALDEYRRLSAERDQARRDDDRWLEEQLSRRLDDARRNVLVVQDEKSALTGRASREADSGRVDRSTVRAAASEVASLPGQLLRNLVAPDMSAVAERLQAANDARLRLQGQLDAQDPLFARHDALLDEYRRLRAGMANSSDQAAVDPWRDRLADVQRRLHEVTRDMARIHEANAQWQRRAAQAHVQALVTSGDLTLRSTSAVRSSQMVNRLVDQYSRGNLPWQPGLRASGGGDYELGGARPPSSPPEPRTSSASPPPRPALHVADGSAASPEAMSRMAHNRLFRVDARSGQVIELHGVDAVDVSVDKYQLKVILDRATGRMTIVDAGSRVTGNLRMRQAALDAVGRFSTGG